MIPPVTVGLKSCRSSSTLSFFDVIRVGEMVHWQLELAAWPDDTVYLCQFPGKHGTQSPSGPASQLPLFL